MGTGSFPGVNRPRRRADHPPHLSAKVKKGKGYTSTHPLGLHGLLWEEPLPLLWYIKYTLVSITQNNSARYFCVNMSKVMSR